MELVMILKLNNQENNNLFFLNVIFVKIEVKIARKSVLCVKNQIEF